MRKGQTAMEYLMTYGWAILIILIVAGVLAYYGVFCPSGFLGPSIRGFSTVYVLQPWNFQSNGNLTIQVENRVGASINITHFYGKLGTSYADVSTGTGGLVIPESGRSNFTNATFGNTLAGASGSTYNLQLWIEYYTTDPNTKFNSTGYLSGARA